MVYPVLTNEEMTTESQRYNCFTRNGGNAIPKHASPEAKGSNRRVKIECGGTRAETRFGLSAKRTSPFLSAGLSVQSTAGSRGVRISGSNAG